MQDSSCGDHAVTAERLSSAELNKRDLPTVRMIVYCSGCERLGVTDGCELDGVAVAETDNDVEPDMDSELEYEIEADADAVSDVDSERDEVVDGIMDCVGISTTSRSGSEKVEPTSCAYKDATLRANEGSDTALFSSSRRLTVTAGTWSVEKVDNKPLPPSAAVTRTYDKMTAGLFSTCTMEVANMVALKLATVVDGRLIVSTIVMLGARLGDGDGVGDTVDVFEMDAVGVRVMEIEDVSDFVCVGVTDGDLDVERVSVAVRLSVMVAVLLGLSEIDGDVLGEYEIVGVIDGVSETVADGVDDGAAAATREARHEHKPYSNTGQQDTRTHVL